MINFAVYVLTILFALLVEGTVRHLPLVSIRVDLILLIVLYLGFFVPLFPGGIVVLLLGLIQETVGVPFHGVLPVVYVTVFLLLRLTHQHLFFQGGSSQVIWIMILSFAAKGIELGLLVWQGYEPNFSIFQYVVSAFLQGLASLALFPFLRNQGRIASQYGP